MESLLLLVINSNTLRCIGFEHIFLLVKCWGVGDTVALRSLLVSINGKVVQLSIHLNIDGAGMVQVQRASTELGREGGN
jgi:hypothetical protein